MLGIDRERLERAGAGGNLVASDDGDLWRLWQEQGNAIAGLNAELDEALREARDLLRELSEGELPPGVVVTTEDRLIVQNRASSMIPGR